MPVATVAITKISLIVASIRLVVDDSVARINLVIAKLAGFIIRT